MKHSVKRYVTFLVLTLALLTLHQSAVAQAFDGDDDNKIYVGYLNAGGLSGAVVGYDKGVNDWLSIGFGASYLAKDKHDVDNDGVNTRLDLMLTGNYHWQEILKLPMAVDVYSGLHVGLRTAGLQAGARYNFSETLGVFLEARQNLLTISKSSNDRKCYYYKKFCFSVGLTFNL